MRSGYRSALHLSMRMMALGTAMASILFTAVSSVRAHHARKAVNWDVAKAMALQWGPGKESRERSRLRAAVTSPAP